MKIPFTRPYVGSEEREAVLDALGRDTLGGDGPIGRRVEEQLEAWLDVEHAFLTTSCTHAIEMALIALDVGPRDEVIMPSFNFVSTANAAVLRGATPVFAEIQPGDLNLDPRDVATKLTDRTKAIFVVHYAGVACDMDAFAALGRDANVAVVEDAAQGIDASFKGRPLGTVGAMGCFSFHETKNLTCGEGGALVTKDEELARRVELVREKGTNRAAFLRGEVDKYSWVSLGSSYVQSEILAALLEAQLAKRDEIKRKRGAVWQAYHRALAPLAEAGRVVLPEIPSYADPNYHIFFFRTPSLEHRGQVMSALKDAGIGATFHYVPLHSSPFGREVAKSDAQLAVTDRCSETLIRLPVYPQLAESADELAARVAGIVEEQLDGAPEAVR